MDAGRLPATRNKLNHPELWLRFPRATPRGEMRSNHVWTEEEIKKLRSYAEAGHSAYRIAAATRRTVSSVRAMATRHEISIRSGRTIRAHISQHQNA